MVVSLDNVKLPTGLIAIIARSYISAAVSAQIARFMHLDLVRAINSAPRIICVHARRTHYLPASRLRSQGETWLSITRSSENLQEQRATGAEILFIRGRDFSVSQPVNSEDLDRITSTSFWQPAFYLAVVFPAR